MKYKKISIVLAIVVILTLSGCTGKNTDPIKYSVIQITSAPTGYNHQTVYTVTYTGDDNFTRQADSSNYNMIIIYSNKTEFINQFHDSAFGHSYILYLNKSSVIETN